MSGKFFSKFDSEYFSLFIFLKYLLLLLLIMIYVPKMTLLEKSKICRTFRAVGHLGTLQTYGQTDTRTDRLTDKVISIGPPPTPSGPSREVSIDVHVLISQSYEWCEFPTKLQATSGSLSFSNSNLSHDWFGFFAFFRRTRKVF